MLLEFDPKKDAANVAKHGISLQRAGDLDVVIVVDDDRFDEPRHRAYGLIDGVPHCLAFTLRGDSVRVISLRRATRKEVERYAR
jgi:uncharacterized DUF497 family protein